jgi:gamma-glutamylaminecyclotransferase
MRIFAFGTLKKGYALHDEGLSDAEFLGNYRTVQRFPMLIAGSWFAPMMLDAPGKGLRVKGELYNIAESKLPLLDALESVGSPGHFRKSIQVCRDDGSETGWAFAFLKSPDLAIPVHSGYLDEYTDGRFVPPWERQR